MCGLDFDHLKLENLGDVFYGVRVAMVWRRLIATDGSTMDLYNGFANPINHGQGRVIQFGILGFMNIANFNFIVFDVLILM